MTVRPLGPEGVRARIAEIESRIASLEQFDPPPASSGTHAFVPIPGYGAGMHDMNPLVRTLGSETVAPMPAANLMPANQNINRSQLIALADKAAAEFGIDPQVFHQLIKWESDWNPNSVSSKGAQGLTQLMPETARQLGVLDPFDPMQNLRGGAKYLREQLDRFGSLELALAAYNAGPGAVKKYRGIPPFAETQTYVKRILGGLSR